MTFREIAYLFFMVAAIVFGFVGLCVITPLSQPIDAATAMSHDRIFGAVVLFLLGAIAVKP